MKIKINWGWGIVMALATFMIFIGSIVFQLLFNKKYDHQLVSENYYKDELLYQLEVNKIERSEKLPENVRIQNKDGKIRIHFPESMIFSEITGIISYQYVKDAQFDFEQKIELNSTIFEVDSTKLKRGTWRIKVDWKYQNVTYLLKEKIVY